MPKIYSPLDFQIILHRTGRVWLLVTAFVLAAVAVYLLGTMPLRDALRVQSGEMDRLRRLARSTPSEETAAKPLNLVRLEAFVGLMGSTGEMNRFVAILFEEARKHEVILAQAEYKLDSNRVGGFSTYQVTLPVVGTYPRLRQFVNATLQEVPCAALAEIEFKRGGIDIPEIEAKLRFVFYLKGVQL